jgi:electron transport complex protein RnfG
MNGTKRKTVSPIRLVAVLLVISAVTALALALVNFITEDKIAAIKAEKTAAAMTEVMPGDFRFEQVPYDGGDPLVKAVYHAISGSNTYGYVVEVTPSGFGGEIDIVVGIDINGAVTGVSIVSMSETSGLGTNASKPAFKDQYTVGAAPFAVNKDGGTIQALTGATVTSRAVTRGVNAAVVAVRAPTPDQPSDKEG